VQEVGGEEDAAAEAHEQAEDAPSASAVSLHAALHVVRQHGEREGQHEHQHEADQLRQPTIHRRRCQHARAPAVLADRPARRATSRALCRPLDGASRPWGEGVRGDD